MSQNDMIIANANGATARADLNSALQALASTSKGNGRPSTPYSGQLWLDDNTPSSTVWTLFMYDGTDDIPMGYWDTTNNVFIPAGIGAGTATIASASTVDLGSTPETSITISGTTTITSFGTSMKPGQAKIVTFSGALTLTNNGTSLILPGGANITTAAGDQALVHCLSSGNYRVMYHRANGASVSSTPTRQYLTSGTSATYTTPAGCRRIRVQEIGAGGGGGGNGTASATSGGAGGDTSFNSIVAKGGSGGTANNNNANGVAGGAGGTGGSGSAAFRRDGSNGSGTLGVNANYATSLGGAGGSSLFGGAGLPAAQASPTGVAAKTNSGAGGSGATASSSTYGGAGGGGAGEYVEFEISNPSASYTYTVGTAGTAGSAGTGGNAGGAGGSGLIIVDEFY